MQMLCLPFSSWKLLSSVSLKSLLQPYSLYSIWSISAEIYFCDFLSLTQVKLVIGTLSGVELEALKAELQQIKDAFSLAEFSDDEEEEKEGNYENSNLCELTELF